MSATKRDIAYKRIKEMILQGDLTSEFTPSEKSLGDELGMSRTPVREALQRLVMEGFMKGCSHKGSMVNEISIAEAVEIGELRMAVEEFVILRRSSQPSAIRRLSLRATWNFTTIWQVFTAISC